MIATAALALQSQSNNAIYPDVPDNHFVYDLLRELKSDGLLPELSAAEGLLRGNRPLTRGQIGRFVVQGTMNLQQFIDEHRKLDTVDRLVKYSDTVSDLTGDQLKYNVGLTFKLRKVGKIFSGNLPTYVSWKGLDRSLEDEGKLIDGLLAKD